MTTKTFTRLWYSLLVVFIIAGCAAFIGSRDTVYQGDRNADAPQTTEQAEWWAATVMLRTNSGKQWCSGVAVNNIGDETYIVTAKHCTDKMVMGTVSYCTYAPDGSLLNEFQYRVIDIFNHKDKDFAVLVVDGKMPFTTPVYCATPKPDRQDYIIGYRGDGHGGKFKFGKYISPAWAYKGQSGGGVFSPGMGLHAIVSTHVDGVNVFIALKEMKMEFVLSHGN